MLQQHQARTMVWHVAVLAAVVVLTLKNAPIPVLLALIACLPRRVGDQPPRRRHPSLGSGGSCQVR